MIRFALILLVVVATPVLGRDLSPYAGKYIGCAVSSGTWVPIATTLSVSGDGLSGDYVFIEAPDRWVPGTLAFASREGDARVTFVWTDIYGTGSASFGFSAGGNRFDGYWTGNGERFPWSGVRQGSGLPQPDCSAPIS
ncbi:MAG: hypothetical protein WAU86_20665 [Oricola sp.]